MMSQSPLAAKICVPRPDWFRAATAMATTPSPKQMSTNVPRTSARYSPAVVLRKPARACRAEAEAVVAMSGHPLGLGTGDQANRVVRARRGAGVHGVPSGLLVGKWLAEDRHVASLIVKRYRNTRAIDPAPVKAQSTP